MTAEKKYCTPAYSLRFTAGRIGLTMLFHTMLINLLFILSDAVEAPVRAFASAQAGIFGTEAADIAVGSLEAASYLMSFMLPVAFFAIITPRAVRRPMNLGVLHMGGDPFCACGKHGGIVCEFLCYVRYRYSVGTVVRKLWRCGRYHPFVYKYCPCSGTLRGIPFPRVHTRRTTAIWENNGCYRLGGALFFDAQQLRSVFLHLYCGNNFGRRLCCHRIDMGGDLRSSFQ